MPLLALGLCLVACGVLIPASEANRLIEAQRLELAAQVQALHSRADLNDEFLSRLHRDEQLANRLSRRQTTPEPDGDVAVLASSTMANGSLSPFAMLRPEPVEAAPAPEADGSRLAEWCRDARGRLAVIGIGLGCGLIALLAGGTRSEPDVPSAA